MSELARAEFDDARIQQTTQNDARRIFQRVDAAQQNPTRAGVRWPFELIQNAHDAGPRDGDDRVQINFVLRDDRLTVSHTGKPFVAQELAALLSGGSSKEFDSEETTGRFGTGFLVTHSVSTRVDVEGVLTTQEGSEVFRIKLDRDGDEDSIIGNIEQANESLENAEPALEAWVSSNPTASFIYHNPSSDVVRRGLDRLEQTLPYLYATCSKLGRVVIQRFGEAKSFEPECLDKSNEGDFDIYKTQVNISTACGSSMVTAVRIGPADGQSALLTVLEHCGTDERQVLVPTEGFARVFVKFPVAGTDFLPFNVALEGNFAISQERDGIAMNDTDRTAIDGALSAFPTLIQHAVESGWRDAHKLASLAAPTRTFSGEAESGELQWWNEIVLQTATQTASKPLVQTELGLLPALPEQGREFVSFPVPAIAADATECIDYDTFHAVVGGVTELNLPSVEVAESWGGIARQWGQAGVPVNRLGLSELTNLLKEKGDLVSDLPIHGESYSWLAQLFLLAADLKDQNVRDMVNGLLPNQHDELCNTTTDLLYGDGGISQEVKDIASALNEDIRAELLHDAMAKALMAPGYESANELVRSLLEKTDIDGGDYTESKAIELILDQLAKVLPDESQFDDDTRLPALTASARMVVHIAGNEDVQRLRRCPLLTAAGRIVYLSGNQQILAPARYWPESAQPYAELYAENRLLSDSYCDENGLASALEALITVSLVVAAPLFEGRRAELADVNLLREMSQGEPDTVGAIVRDARFGQIAFLATDLMQRCGEKEELAKLLLDFVLNVAAREDQSWREIGSFAGNRSGERISLTMNKAIWPFELKVRSWIPVKAPDADAIAPMPANESNLREILDPSWLKGNRDAVDLLHQIFGFRQLTLLLDSFGTEIEGDLVELLQYPELVKAAANNPDALRFASELKDTDVTLDSVRDFVKDAAEDEKLLEHLANRRKQRRQVHENQNLGALIETLVRDNLKIAGFSVRRTGVGSDFEIAVETGHLANLHITKEKQSWLVEVKATRDQRVRMTDTQAKTAVDEENRFLLCVVPVESGDTNPQAADIWPNMRFVAGLGDRLANLCNNLGDFEDMRVDITADAATGVQLEISPGPARVRVASSVWEDDGFPLDELAVRLLT